MIRALTGGDKPIDPTETKERVRALLTQHKDRLSTLGLDLGAEGILHRVTRPFDYRNVRTAIFEIPWRRYTDLVVPESGIEAWLETLRDELAKSTPALLDKGEAALKDLVDTVLTPEAIKSLGGEPAIRTHFLTFSATLSVHQATHNVQRRLLEARTELTRHELPAIGKRVRLHTKGRRIVERSLEAKYRETFQFRSSELTLEVNVEKPLDVNDIEKLRAASDADFPAAVEEVLVPARAMFRQKVAQQLADLASRVRTLPHIELLSDEEITNVVAPYYGGVNKALKRHRARTAFVAVEERAREAKYHDDVGKLNEHRDAYADVASYYPVARGLKRKLILYVGPTNSGKTWRALNDLASGETGAYLAPLRLLALEGQEEIEKRGKIASFLTGEERDLRPGATFTSSTIEMMSPDHRVDAVVVDEVQLLTDERRGWAWLAAVVGAPAKRVIMTGSPDCVDLVKNLASYLGEELTIVECQRHNELRVAPAPTRWKDLKPSTAVVCFSRRDVLRIKEQIQSASDMKVAVVYGNLSPQTRREEARRFRSGEAQILVATDAIAMGLNLPIKEVVFFTTEKFDGESVRELTAPEIRQIAGRAGRYGFADFGVTSALDQQGLARVSRALKAPAPMLEPPFFVAPGPNHVKIISEVLGTKSLERILTFFERAIEFSDPRFARSNIDDLSYLSTYVDERLPSMAVEERLTIASAPVAIRNETVVGWFLDRMLPAFTGTTAALRRLDELFDEASTFEQHAASGPKQMLRAEDYLKALTVYAWLAYRYPDVFTRIEECEIVRESVNAFVERSLKEGEMRPKGEDEPGRPKRDRSRGGGGGGGKRGKRRR